MKNAKKMVEGLEEAVTAPEFGTPIATYRSQELVEKIKAWTPGYQASEQGRVSRTGRWDQLVNLLADKFSSKFTDMHVVWEQEEHKTGVVFDDITSIHLYEKGRKRYSQNVKLVLHRTAVKLNSKQSDTSWDMKLFVYKNGMPKQLESAVVAAHTIGEFKKALKSLPAK